MRLKKSPQLDALLQASEARGLGLKVRNPLSESGVKLPPELNQKRRGVGASSGQEVQEMQNRQYRIMGIDTALRKTGWGIIDAAKGLNRAVDCGVIISRQDAKITECLSKLHQAMQELLAQYKPDIAVIEGGFYSKNVRTSVILGTARGAVLGVLAAQKIPVYEYAPRKVKQAICGFGNASKPQVARLVSQYLNIQVEHLPDDATDALGLTLTHAQNIFSPLSTGIPEEL